MMNKPLIVISAQQMPMEPPYDGRYNYSNTFNSSAVRSAGGIPVLSTFLDDADAMELMARCDGLFLSGGADVSPDRYGAEAIPQCGTTQPDRDEADYALLRAALALHKPVLCICRGFQLANVFFGGTLWQDLDTQCPSDLAHRRRDSIAYPVHSVRVVAQTPLAELFGTEALMVNSLHHQAVRTLAPNLRPMAYAPDGLVESWYLDAPDQWVRGFQWHPEMLADQSQCLAIFRAFFAACGR